MPVIFAIFKTRVVTYLLIYFQIAVLQKLQYVIAMAELRQYPNKVTVFSVCLSVRPSVRLSVMLVDCNHIQGPPPKKTA